MNAAFWLEENSCVSLHADDVRAEILLGRKPHPIPLDECRPLIEGRTILVTGAGGFIGSAICRALAALNADLVIAADISENSLARLAQDWQDAGWSKSLRVELCDIRDEERFQEILREYRPSQIYHSAAYKHVPLLEQLPFDAIENNAIATRRIAVLAADEGIERFLLISSDKAAAAINTLGISKRLAEIFIAGINRHGCRFTALRCGNVLGSPGSVLPRFIEQAQRGAPLTVCDPEADRYFVTVKEAAHAAIQACRLVQDADIFVPQMGAPIRILDLARRVISRLPFDPGIELTGLRSGDQRNERLVSTAEQLLPTALPGLWRIPGSHFPEVDLDCVAAELANCCRRRDQVALFECAVTLLRGAHPVLSRNC